MNLEAVRWQHLNERILPKIDPSWFSIATGDLLREAIDAHAARPLLWRELAGGPAFGHLLGQGAEQSADDQAAFLLDEHAVFPLLLELGSLAHAVTIRTLVDRASVLNLKEVLGPSLYARAVRLRVLPSGTQPPSDEAAALRNPDASVPALRELVQRQGAREAMCWLKRNGDQSSASLLALRCPRGWSDERAGGVLSESVVTVCWNDAVQRHRESPP